MPTVAEPETKVTYTATQLLESCLSKLYNPFEPENQSELYKDITNFLKAKRGDSYLASDMQRIGNCVFNKGGNTKDQQAWNRFKERVKRI